MTTDIHSCGPTCCNKKCIEARRDLLTGDQCNEFRRMACSFDDMIRAIYAAGMAQSAVPAQIPEDVVLPLMSQAFRTTVADGSTADYRMMFKFKEMESLHEADAEWRKFRDAL